MGEEYIVGQEEAGERLIVSCQGKVESYSRTYIQKLIEEGHCKVNGKNASPGSSFMKGTRWKP